jgi:inosose dehydratase
VENGELTVQQWDDLFNGHNRLGKVLAEEYGLAQQFHSHADSHVCVQPDIERFLQHTDPQLVTLCLDTGHAEYGGASSVDLIGKYPERIGYLHLKQIDPEVLKTVREQNLTWAAANTAGVMTEPPNGLPDLSKVIDAVERLDKPIFGIVEQDMYPVADFGVPMPIARRTCKYLLSCGSRTRVQ